ncbi:MAG: hypothetical protein JXL97_09700 [Bacteroidales bacterium]|nr:hypothetical protein [Bacteroidales bacterium]
MIRKISLLLSFVFVITTAFSQQKDFDKIKALYEKTDYEKCIDKSKDVIKKYPKEATPYYYIATSNFQQYKTASRLSKKMYMTSTLNNINFGLVKDPEKKDFEQFGDLMNEIHDTLLVFANNLWETNRSESEFFYKNLAKIYSDTTEQYIELFVPKIYRVDQNLAFKEHNGPINEKDIAGNRQGLWVKKYDNGLVESEIFFKDNHPAGVYRKYYENGNLMANMHFDESGKKAAAILYNEDGSKMAMGYYQNQQKDSLWQYFMNDSIVLSEENYKNGIKNGFERTYNPYYYPAYMDEKFWKDGLQDSTWTRYYTNGQPQFYTEYKKGIRQGKYVAFDEEGQTIVEGKYVDGRMDGVWKMWDEDERKIIEVEYKNGVPINNDELTERETEIHNEMMEMKGKFEEPGNQFYEDNNVDDY